MLRLSGKAGNYQVEQKTHGDISRALCRQCLFCWSLLLCGVRLSWLLTADCWLLTADCWNCANYILSVKRFGKCNYIPFAHEKTIPRNEVLFQGADGRAAGKLGFTTVYYSSAAPSFLAGGCYLCLNDIIAFPPARVLPFGKTRIRHLARIPQFVDRTYSQLYD